MILDKPFHFSLNYLVKWAVTVLIGKGYEKVRRPFMQNTVPGMWPKFNALKPLLTVTTIMLYPYGKMFSCLDVPMTGLMTWEHHTPWAPCFSYQMKLLCQGRNTIILSLKQLSWSHAQGQALTALILQPKSEGWKSFIAILLKSILIMQYELLNTKFRGY